MGTGLLEKQEGGGLPHYFQAHTDKTAQQVWSKAPFQEGRNYFLLDFS